MAIVAAQLSAVVKAEGIETTERQLENVGKKAEETKGHFEGLKHALSTAAGFAIFGGLTAGFGFLKDQIGSVIGLTEDYQRVTADTVNTLQHMGGASGQTAESIRAFAEHMAETTTFSAETVQQGENLMLTFGDIGKKVFPEASTAAVELAAKMGMDLQSAVIQVGKALNDPVQGMNALRREGVSFTEDEQKQIKTLIQHKDLLDAQKIVLFELNKQFGGTAETMGKTFGGRLEILSHQFDDLKIKIGGALLPVLNDLLNKYVVPLAQKFQDWMLKGGGLQDFQNWLRQAVALFENQFLPDLNQLLNQYIIPLAANFYDVFIKSGLLQNVWQDTVNVLQTMMPMVGQLVLDLANFADWLSKDTPGADALKVAILGIGIAIAGVKLAGWLNDVNTGIGKIITNAGNMKDTFVKFLQWFGDTFGSQFKQHADTAASDLGNSARTMETDLGEVTVTADATGTAVEGIGTKAEIAAGESGVGGLVKAVSGLFALVGITLGVALIQEQLTILTGMIQAGPQNSATVTGRAKHYHGPHGFASGGTNISAGTYLVGERGPELMQVPQGSNIIPNNMISSPASASGTNQPLILSIDGMMLARAVLPHLTNQIRYQVGSIGW